MAEDFSFAVLGDCKSDISLIYPEAFRQNIRAIDLLDPNFVVFLGDFVKGDTSEALLEDAWMEFYREIKFLRIPYYLIVGNHDIQYRAGRELFGRKYGRPYYSFDYGNSHFVLLDSEEKGEGKNCIAGRQLDWLRQDLKAHRDAEHIFVFLHKPLWEIETGNWNHAVHPLLTEYGVELAFAGHRHLYQRPVVKDGVKYIVTSGGGSPLRAWEMEGGFYHWVHVVVRGEEVSLAVIRPEGVLSEEGVPLPSWEQLGWVQKRSFGPAFIEDSKQVPFVEEISVKIRNPLDLSVYGKIRWSCPEGWEVLPERREYFIESRSESDLTFEVKAGEGTNLTYPLPCYEVTLSWERESPPIATGRRGLRLRRRFVCRRAKHRIKIDGKLDDWEGFKPLCLDRKEQVVGPWGGPDDLSAQVYLAWNEEYLYFAAAVRDDGFHQPYTAENTWQGDSVQIAFDISDDDSAELDDGDYEYTFALTPEGGRVFRLFVVDGKLRGEEVEDVLLRIDIDLEERRHIYQAAIPWSQLEPFKPRDGAVCGFNVVVNDNDGRGPKSWIGWTPEIRGSKDTSYFGDLVFEAL